MRTILAAQVATEHVGRTVAFYAAGRRVCGVLDGHCRRGAWVYLRVDGSWVRDVPCTSEVDVLEVAA